MHREPDDANSNTQQASHGCENIKTAAPVVWNASTAVLDGHLLSKVLADCHLDCQSKHTSACAPARTHSVFAYSAL